MIENVDPLIDDVNVLAGTSKNILILLVSVDNSHHFNKFLLHIILFQILVKLPCLVVHQL